MLQEYELLLPQEVRFIACNSWEEMALLPIPVTIRPKMLFLSSLRSAVAETWQTGIPVRVFLWQNLRWHRYSWVIHMGTVEHGRNVHVYIYIR